MTGAMYAAIAGLKSHMNKLNVIGNNIANVNTYGYKSKRVVFSDMMYTTSTAGSAGDEVAGGVNPSQVGYGVKVSSIDINMTTGTYNPTGQGTDCMIDGDGFFLVGDKDVQYTIDAMQPESFKALTLTRVGDFTFKADGYLSDGNGSVVYGFLCTGYYDATNIANAPAGTEIGDPMFSNQLVPICFPRIEQTTNATTGVVTSTIMYPSDATGSLVAATGANGAELPFAGMDSIGIDPSTGLITGTSKDTDEEVVIGCIAIGNVTNPNGVAHSGGAYYKAQESAGDLTISLMGGASETTGITHVGNGLPAGTTGDAIPDGSVVTSAGTTALITGGLEMSTTDLATEIAEMITTQRGYQANTRIITVTDSMLEELVNMKR